MDQRSSFRDIEASSRGGFGTSTWLNLVAVGREKEENTSIDLGLKASQGAHLDAVIAAKTAGCN